jgi:XTP/dITP diphosphohydrolase
LVATRSPGKTREILELFAGLPFHLVFPDELELDRLPEEGDLEHAETYAGNAVSKARHFAGRSGLPTVADDSGIEVDALGGAPGVHSARYAQQHGFGAGLTQDAANNALLLGGSGPRSAARYRCGGVSRTPTASPEMVEATCEVGSWPRRGVVRL